MDMEHILSLAVYGLIILFVLVQWFLSLRPFFLWGLLMPLLFGLLWYAVTARPDFLPFAAISFNEGALALYARVGRLGLLFSLALFALCRAAMLLKKGVRSRARQRRVEEKRQRQLREAATMAAGEPENLR